MAWFFFISVEQKQRVALLGRYLGRYHIEKLMEALTEGYLRALSDPNPANSRMLWATLDVTERNLLDEYKRFVVDFSGVWGEKALVCRLPFAVPRATQLFPQATFDLRQVLALHARGLAAAMENAEGRSQRDRAFTVTAELLLMQHSCLWFCRSQTRASAHLLARHKTSYAQVLAAVLPQTRKAYCALAGCRV
jgi:hypothetical protein